VIPRLRYPFVPVGRLGWAYVALQSADLELLERLTGLVAVADILEGLSGILAADVEKNLLATAIQKTFVSTCL
jgi:hypothetical protein